MRIYTETSMEDFEAWSGAIETLERIKEEGKCDQLERLLEDIEPEEGWKDVDINDLLWFESDWIFESLGITEEDEEEEEEEEDEEEREYNLFVEWLQDNYGTNEPIKEFLKWNLLTNRDDLETILTERTGYEYGIRRYLDEIEEKGIKLF